MAAKDHSDRKVSQERSSPPSLHLQAESPPVLAVDVIVAADPPDELVSPGAISGVGADDGAAEEEISQRYLRREGDFVEIVMSPEGGIVHVIHPAFQSQAEILVEMNNGPNASGKPMPFAQ